MEQRKIIAENEQRNEQRYNKLYQDYDNEVGKIKSLTEKNDKLQGVNNTLKDENAYLKNECSQTKTKFSKLQDEHGKLKTELSDCKTRYAFVFCIHHISFLNYSEAIYRLIKLKRI